MPKCVSLWEVVHMNWRDTWTHLGCIMHHKVEGDVAVAFAWIPQGLSDQVLITQRNISKGNPTRDSWCVMVPSYGYVVLIFCLSWHFSIWFHGWLVGIVWCYLVNEVVLTGEEASYWLEPFLASIAWIVLASIARNLWHPLLGTICGWNMLTSSGC